MRFPLFLLAPFLFAESIFAQTNHPERLFIPFLNTASQSNVDVSISDFFGNGSPCPNGYSNVLSNTNLFTSGEQKTISEIFGKYKYVTTNSGPPDTVFQSLRETNFMVGVPGTAARRITNWVASFLNTNTGASEEVHFGGGVLSAFRGKSGDGYNVSFNRTGGGTLLSFVNIKHGQPNGLAVQLQDGKPQGLTWDFRLADFSSLRLTEYRRYTNNMAVGRFLMWDPETGNLLLSATFNEPYDIERNRNDLQNFQQYPIERH